MQGVNVEVRRRKCNACVKKVPPIVTKDILHRIIDIGGNEMIKSKGSDGTIRPDQNTFDIKDLEAKSNTELLEAIEAMMARPAEEIDGDFVDACLDILQDREPVMEDYDPQATLDRLHEEHPALFEIEEAPPAKAAPAKHRRRVPLLRYTGAFVAAVLCLVVTANAFGYHPIQAFFRWVNDTVQIFSNPSGLMELPPDDPSEYHSLDEALETSGLESADRISWIPKDYSITRVQIDKFKNTVQASAIYESNRGELVVRILAVDGGDWSIRAESSFEGLEYRHNNTVYYISSNFDIIKTGWEDDRYSYEISGQVSEEEVKKMIDSIT